MKRFIFILPLSLALIPSISGCGGCGGDGNGGEGGGIEFSISISPDTIPPATETTFTITGTIEEGLLKAGTEFAFFFPFNTWSGPSVECSSINTKTNLKNAKISVSRSDTFEKGISLELGGSLEDQALSNYLVRVIFDNDMRSGEGFTLLFGDAEGGCNPATSSFVAGEFLVRSFHKPPESPRYEEEHELEPLKVIVTPLDAERFRVSIPGTGDPGSTVPIRVAAIDRFGNIDTGYSTSTPVIVTPSIAGVEIIYPEGGEGLFLNEGYSGSALLLLSGSLEGEWLRLAASDGEIEGSSNPMLLMREELAGLDIPGLYFGTLHNHTLYSDGDMSLEQALAFARDAAGMDFFAPSDHDQDSRFLFPLAGLDEGEWDATEGILDSAHDPEGSIPFTTIAGYEWTKGVVEEEKMGHVNVYFLPEADNYSDSDSERVIAHESDEGMNQCLLWNTLYNLYGGSSSNFITLPHATCSPPAHEYPYTFHPGGCPEIDPSIPPLPEDVMPLIGVYDYRGNCEDQDLASDMAPPLNTSSDPRTYVKSALSGENGSQRVFHPGFTGDGDNHSGNPGADFNLMEDPQGVYTYYRNFYVKPTGITGLFGPSLKRDDIFDALKGRHTYATTGDRIILYFSIEDPSGAIHLMGDGPILTASQEELTAHLIVVADSRPLMRVELFGLTAGLYRPIKVWEGGIDFEEGSYSLFGDYTLPSMALQEGENMLFVRVQCEIEEIGGKLDTYREMAWGSPIWVEVTSD